MLSFIKAIFLQHKLLLSLIRNDFRTKYVNNFLGIFWAFIQPTVTILIFWFVFQMGFKSGSVGDTPFILWFISGMIPWFYISESLSSTCGAVKDNAFLVKKIVFRVSLLPIVKQSSALIVHTFFVLFMLAMFLFYGYKPTVYWIQLIYYMFCTTILLIGIAWFTSSVVIFFNDLSQIVAMITQFGFWLTPIFWQLTMVPLHIQWIFKASPAYYITQGFRDSLIDSVWFWEKPYQTLAFWTITCSILFLGATIFRKLRPHFADVL